jgi:DNA repair protein RecO (recombination protein O)
MWQSIRGIFLKKIQYSDSKYLLKILTENEGVGTFSIRVPDLKKTSVIRSSIGQPLSFVEFICFNKPSSEIKAIKDIHADKAYIHIPHDMIRQTLAIFVNELILQTIQLPMQDKNLYSFLKHSLKILDSDNLNKANFPVWFALQLSLQLGIGPKTSDFQPECVFDLVSGKFMRHNENPGVTLSEELSILLHTFTEAQSPPEVHVPKQDRMHLLQFTLDYLTFHADFHPRIKSAEILSIVFQ